jgi:hypothetical protein
MFLGSKVRLVRGADNLTAIYKPIVETIWGILNISQPYRPPQPVTGIALFILSFTNEKLYSGLIAECYHMLISVMAQNLL